MTDLQKHFPYSFIENHTQKAMDKTVNHSQHSFLDFNQPLGLHMNPENRWIKMADRIPWDIFEEKYAKKINVYVHQNCSLSGKEKTS